MKEPLTTSACISRGDCPPKHRSTKDRNRWCGGHEGRLHKYKWVPDPAYVNFDYSEERKRRDQCQQCQRCGKLKDRRTLCARCGKPYDPFRRFIQSKRDGLVCYSMVGHCIDCDSREEKERWSGRMRIRK